MNFQVGNIWIPFIIDYKEDIESLVDSIKIISEIEWNTKELSFGFQQNELLRHKADAISNHWTHSKNSGKTSFS